MNKVTIRDYLDGITVLYYGGCQAGFKFFGDDPEEEKIYVKQDNIDMVKQIHHDKLQVVSAIDYLRRFYAHSRCLLFPKGMWLSETAGYAQALHYKPGTHLSLRISGLTRFTALTEGAEAICIGVDPDAKDLSCRERRVIKVDDRMMFTPMSRNSIIIPTEDCSYGGHDFAQATLHRAFNSETEIKFKKPGFIVEYSRERMDLNKAVLEYCDQVASERIEIIERTQWVSDDRS